MVQWNPQKLNKITPEKNNVGKKVGYTINYFGVRNHKGWISFLSPTFLWFSL